MKKLVLTLIVALGFCGLGFAQDYESHWPDFYGPAYTFQTPLVAAIQIDGQIITADYEGWDALEVAFFVGDECRGAGSTFPDAVPFVFYLYNGYVEEYGDPFPIIDGAALYYNDGGEEATVKLYDHVRNIEYSECTVTLQGDPYTILTGADNDQGWYDPENPIILSFTTPEPTEPTEYTWNLTEGDWTAPESGANVTIPENCVVIVPDGVVANAGEITLPDNSQIIIEEGGQLYHSNAIEVTMQMNVDGYNTGAKDGEPAPAGYRLIATPVYTDATDFSIPVDETNLNFGEFDEFDLYRFVEAGDAEGKEWFNYKETANNFTKLYRKEGYLYASKSTNNNIAFAGITTPTTYSVGAPLQYTAGKRLAGWNLLGNPYTCNAYVTYNNAALPYYKMNDAGSELEAVQGVTAIAPMQGIFVEASTEIPSCLFTTTAPSRMGNLNIMVSQGRGKVDNAILSFGNGSSLEKFQLNPNHTKVYMTQEGKDYAVVNAPEMGEMPVSFKAEKNGSYTLSFTNQEVTFSYLHLIDNLTGIETDLLATPSYTFNAQTTDYASRFRLVFATGSSINGDNFGFFNQSGNFCIFGIEGEATLQVIDVLGHMLSSETFSGSIEKQISAAPGVYMIRLINGDDVKVQKVVVK